MSFYDCPVNVDKVVGRLFAPTYEDDKMGVHEVVKKDYLILHEAVGICILEKMAIRSIRTFQ